jgi:hypothetical protein
MARLITAGAELNTLTTSVEIAGSGGAAMSVSSSIVKSGSYAYRCNGLSSGVNSFLSFQTTSVLDVAFARVNFYVATLPTAANTVIRLNDGSNNTRARLTIDSTGKLSMPSINTNGPTLSVGFWYCIEFRLDRTPASGSHQVYCRVNGGNEFGSSALTLSSGFNRFWVGGNMNATAETQTTGDWYFDDIAVNDNTGSYQNSYPGPGSVIALRPNAAGDVNTFATQTGGTAGAGNNFGRVNEVTPDDATTFNGSSTLNEEDLFNCGDSGLPANAIVSVVSTAVIQGYRPTQSSALSRLQRGCATAPLMRPRQSNSRSKRRLPARSANQRLSCLTRQPGKPMSTLRLTRARSR